ncbi:MAG TPA: hypothetical protein VG518_01045 [Solirubrobacterales bacterium]|nr:hypothetical protein [Solirubrobacterales bacterium]
MAGVLVALAALVAGCGAEEHVNNPRPQAPTRVSVTLTREGVAVQPETVGVGPDRTQQIPQNQHSAQPPIHTKAPLTVVFVVGNLTGSDSRLTVRGPKDITSPPFFANTSGGFQADLPTGAYTIRATDAPGAKPGHLTVGPYRASSQNDVLLP